MIELFKMLHSIYDSECTLRLHMIEGQTRGHPLKLFKMRTLRLDLRRNFFPIRTVEEWNKLPEKVVMAQSLNAFKNALDKFWGPRMYKSEGIWNQDAGQH